MKKKLFLFFPALCLCLLLAGCTKVTGIGLPASLELEKGETAQLELEYTYDNAEASDEEKTDAANKAEITYTVEGDAVTVDETAEAYGYRIDCGLGSIELGESSFGGLGTDAAENTDAPTVFDLECGMGAIDVIFT